MATYVYETIQSDSSVEVKRYEIKQSMRDAALTRHPETGERIRRVIVGGFGLMGLTKSPESLNLQRAGGGHCCGGGCGCS